MLEWWQWLIGVITALGLSAAPWIGALLSGRIMTRTQHTDRVADLTRERDLAETRHAGTVARLVNERDYERQRADKERERSDALANQLGELTTEFGATTVHLLRSLPAAPEGLTHGGQ